MEFSSRLPVDLPEGEVAFDAELFFHTESVGGEFGVTAELSTIHNIIEYEEAIRLPHQGYYRLAMHPWLRHLQGRLKEYYALRHAILFNSAPTALKELIDYLVIGHGELTVRWYADLEAAEMEAWRDRLDHIPAASEALTGETLPDPESFSRQQALLLVLDDPESWLKQHEDWLVAVHIRRVPIVCYSRALPATKEPLYPVTHWVASLSGEDTPEIDGGVLLTNLDKHAGEIYERNRRRGGVLSARNAAWFLGVHAAKEKKLRRALDKAASKLGRLEKAAHPFLYPSGMYALTTLIEQLRTPEQGRIIVVGHLYSDTHTLLAEGLWAGGPIDSLFLRADEAHRVEAALDDQVAAIFVETITNPLNEVPDLEVIIRAARSRGVPVIVDNTMASPANCRPLELGADYVIESTSKYLSGANDHGGGAILTNQPEAAARLAAVQSRWHQQLSPLEALVLQDRMDDFDDRMQRFNRNARQVARFLDKHDAVDRVWFAGLSASPFAAVAKRQLDGAGSVVSFTLAAEGLEPVRTFYDPPMEGIFKAPSLGSNVTLLCPYTLLTYYYKDDEYLAEIRLPRYLLRVSVGCEKSIKPVIKTLARALRRVQEKHPAP